MSFDSVENRLVRSWCKASIEASMDFFSITEGRVCVPESSGTLWSILRRCFAAFAGTFDVHDPRGMLTSSAADPTLERVLREVFDSGSAAFVARDCPRRLLASLDARGRAALLAQAVVGLTLVFRRLAALPGGLSEGAFAREMQLFAESEQRRDVLGRIECSPVFGACGDKREVVKLIVDAVDGSTLCHHDPLPLGTLGQYMSTDGVAWMSDRPCRNMGLPWGFTIMEIN